MKLKFFEFQTPEEAQAFIDGVLAVNDSSIRVRTVALDTSSSNPEVTFDIGDEERTLTRPLFVVYVEDLDANEDDE
jgi:hypothetical protein